MIRKLLIVTIFPLLVAAGCADDGLLHRIEVWKQQNLFNNDEGQVIPMMAPMAPSTGEPCGPGAAMAPMAVAPMAAEPTCGAPVSQTVGSPEVIDGVLEQQ